MSNSCGRIIKMRTGEDMKKEFWANVALCLVLGGMLVCALVNISSAVTKKGLLVKDPEPSAIMKELQDKVVLDWYVAGREPQSSNNISSTFHVINSSDKDVKNISVYCEFYGETGNYLDQDLWLLSDVVSAGETKEYKASGKRYIHKKTKAIRCRLVDLKLAGYSFFTLNRGSSAGDHGAPEQGGHGKQDVGPPVTH